MRVFIAFAVLVVLGMVGLVIANESSRGAMGSCPPGVPSSELIETVSTGQEVNLESIIPSDGLTIVCFTADF